MVWFTRKPTYELILMHTKETSFSLTKRLSYFLFVEAAPTSRKGVCQRHVNDIAGFLRGAHVTIKAHHEGDDVEEEKVVLEKVSKSSGARYGSTRKRPDQWNHPVQWVWFTRKLTYELILMQTNETSFGLTKRNLRSSAFKTNVRQEEKAKKQDSEVEEREARERQLCGKREAECAQAIDAQK
ncbi:drebrin-like protein A isoform X1 [Corticium candelabrum]|uniref:drebrin-like protein A isoform X1 n=1 Tax=Corticium candelabrum TaxID=121492 RepID=UPI002E262419|nr:drebrin-like protein A isoform X1 [Corticium candelabrum]XP_062513701.1 drebrin-like protein A isoform X1 [Corticium candelabrum]